METKLTLKLNQEVIERAKGFAKEQQISLSKLIESYLDSITRKKETTPGEEITPLVESLLGVIPDSDTKDARKDYKDFLNKKYA
jgi:hypothetical protein